MKRFLISLFGSIVLAGGILTACTAKYPEGAVISGTVDGVPASDSVLVVLFRHEGGVGRQFLTDTLQNGRFRFVIDTLPDGFGKYSIGLFGKNGEYFRTVLNLNTDLYLEPGAKVRIKGEGKHYFTADVSSNVKDQKLRQRFLKKMSLADWELFQDLYVDRYAAIDKRGDPNITAAERDSLYRLTNDLLEQSNSIQARIQKQTLELMKTEPVGQYWMDRLLAYAGSISHGMSKEIKPQLEKLYASLPQELRESDQGLEIQANLNPIKKVHAGDMLPAYTYLDRSGGKHLMSELRGKYVLMDFWSLGCGPCIESIPYLAKLYERCSERLEIVSISLDTASMWEEARKEHPTSWTEWRDPSRNSGSVLSFESRGIPTFVLVSPEGEVIEIFEGFSPEWIEGIPDRINTQV
jgi:thiol-disulfide isomerase/thioredoxin